MGRGHGERGLRGRERAQAVGPPGGAPDDAPRCACGDVTDDVHAARSSMQQPARHSVLLQDRNRAVDRVSLADGPEIQLHSRTCETHRGGGGVQLHLIDADEVPRAGERPGRGRRSGAAHEAPRAEQGTDGDVEGPVRRPVQFGAVPEEREHARVHPNRFAARGRVDPRDRAGGLVPAQESLDPLDLSKRLLAGRAQPRGIVAGEDQLEPGGHRLQAEGDPAHTIIFRAAASKRTMRRSRYDFSAMDTMAWMRTPSSIGQ